MRSIEDLLRWYKNKDVVPTLKVIQKKMIAFSHIKFLDILKLGRTLPNLTDVCLHKSTDAKFYLFTEGDEDLLH